MIANTWSGFDFGLGADIDMLRDSVRRFAQDKIAQRAAEIDRRISATVASGRVTPAEAEEERSFLAGLPHEKVTARLASLERRAPKTRLSAPSEVTVGDGDARTTVKIDKRAFSTPNGAGVNPVALEIYAEAMSRAGNDPKKFREIALELSQGSRPGGN